MRGIAVLLLIALLFAGCTQPGDRPDRVPVIDPDAPQDDPEETEPEEPEPEDEANTTEEPANGAPTATLSAAVDSNNSLLVTFDLSGADPDNDTLTWTLDVGANGTIFNGSELPANVSHTYDAIGNYTVTLTVSDGDLEGNATVTLELREGGGGVIQSASVEWVSNFYGCGTTYPAHSAGQPTAGVLYGEVELVPDAAGTPYRADFGAMAEADLFSTVQFYDEAGDLAGSDASFDAEMVVIGVVPTGALTAVFSTCGEPGGSADFTVDPSIEVPAE